MGGRGGWGGEGRTAYDEEGREGCGPFGGHFGGWMGGFVAVDGVVVVRV